MPAQVITITDWLAAKTGTRPPSETTLKVVKRLYIREQTLAYRMAHPVQQEGLWIGRA